MILDLFRIWLDALQTECGNPLDRPLDRVSGVPQRAGRAVQDVRVFGIKGAMRCGCNEKLPPACDAVLMMEDSSVGSRQPEAMPV